MLNKTIIYLLQLVVVISLFSCDGLLVTELELEELVDSEFQYGMSGALRYSEQYDTLASRIQLSVVGLNSDVKHTNASPQLYKDNNIIMELFTTDINDVIRYSNLSTDSTEYVSLTPGSYTLTSVHPDHGSISATTAIPETLPELFNIKADSTTDKKNVILSFTFDDPIEEENYYHLSLKADLNDLTYDTLITDIDTSIRSRQPLINITNSSDSSIEISYNDDLLISDKLFNGTSYTGVQEIRFSGRIDSLSFDEIIDALQIEWATISKDLYLFETSYARHLNNEFLGDFSEQTIIYSNVEGGIGYMGGQL